ncbi:MAG: class I SAM-dependent methyltransferase [Gemmataceae bacterium]|nr:class I SAM-dependent methyltransferase [Gemmataceae bacterium]
MSAEQPARVAELYNTVWSDDAPVYEVVRHSQGPRDSDSLYGALGELGVTPQSTVLDLGSRDAYYSLEIAQRFGCRVIGIDPVPLHRDQALTAIREAGLEGRVEPLVAAAEELPLADGAVTHVWCRDTLNHVELARGLPECRRVLAPGGRMLVYQTFAGPAMEPKEVSRLCSAMAFVLENMQPAFFERAAQKAGFVVERAWVVGGEFREANLESEFAERDLTADLLAVSRLNRRYAELERTFGRAKVEATWADCVWIPYHLIGKLEGRVYTLARAG